MKGILIFLVFSYVSLNAQNQIEVLSAFRQKDVCLLKKNLSYPLILSNFNEEVDSDMIVKKNIDSKLKKVFDIFTDGELKNAKTLKFNSLKYGILIRTFNADNELESETILNFYFKKTKSKNYLLIKIELIG